MTGGDGPTPLAGERLWRSLRDAVWHAVVVDELVIRLLAVAVLARGHALIEDVPGVGKTLLARAFSRALGLRFARVQGTPDLLPSDVLGASVLEGGAFRFLAGPVFTNVLLIDEINRATPRTQSALLEAMEESQATIEGETRALPDPFVVLATQNPIELEGTFALPEAQLDRFLVRIQLGYPAEADERRIARRYRSSAEPLEAVGLVAGPEQLLAMRDAVRSIHVSDGVEEYVVGSCARRVAGPSSGWGRAPSRLVALYRASQAWAQEVREVELAGAGFRIARPHLRRTRGAATPRDASEAYLAAIRLLEPEPTLARRPSETPREHARRVDEPALRGAIRRLAADYALGAFAGRRLTEREHRRAIDRWRQVRSRLRRQGRG